MGAVPATGARAGRRGNGNGSGLSGISGRIGGGMMLKSELQEKTQAVKDATRTALQLLYDSINHGQQKQLVKREEIKALFDRYGVTY